MLSPTAGGVQCDELQRYRMNVDLVGRGCSEGFPGEVISYLGPQGLERDSWQEGGRDRKITQQEGAAFFSEEMNAGNCK